ncbi:MAG: putative drug exporter of the superfamily [Solirubrobacterales bacterium]|jgi:RND superfamily putative drug exporter|nr:putative drug exporter of the superfamily [Solirubrobacterales bacterium]
MTRRLAALADFSYRRRGTMVLLWIVSAVLIIGLGSSFAGEYEADYNTPGSDSKAASDLTEREFGGYSGQEIYVVWKDPSGADSPAAKQRMNAFFKQAEAIKNVEKRDTIRLSDDGTIATTTLPLTIPGWQVKKEQGEELIEAAEANSSGGLEIKLGGEPIYTAQEQTSPEFFGFLGAAIVLLIAFGSLVAAGLPLAIALIGLGISSGGLIVLLANVIDVPNWTTAVSGLIGIGVGIDYALLVLTRFRSAMKDGKDRHDAVVEAVTTAGRSVLIAGSTVVIAILGLFITGLPYMYGVAISASLAVLVMMFAAITLLPALLSYLGPNVDRLRIPLLGRNLDAKEDGESPAARWSHAVQRRPWTAAIVAVAILLALAAPALGMRLGFPDAGNDQPDTMTRQAYDLISEGFGPGANGPLVIAAELPDASAKGTVNDLVADLRDENGVAYVAPPRFNSGGTAAILTVIPTTSPQDEETSELVDHLRGTVIPAAVGNSGVNALVGGVNAALEDQSTYVTDRMPWFIAGVVGLSFLLLLVAFHSPFISLKAGVMNLLSVSAAYGVMTIVAQGGALGQLIGIDHEVPIAPFMPVMMFAILFGLSMDYEVFLISRIREEYLKDGDTRRAVADGLAKTARVITAAAAIMVVVFLAFVASPEVFLKLFGIGLAAAIFLDATLVRMVLVPAVMQLLGARNWWIPDWLERILPRIDVEREAPVATESGS